MINSTQTEPDIPIIFEDEHMLVIDKPHNVLSQKDHTGDADILTLCKEYLGRKRGTSGSGYLGLVHRLDRPVGGLMLLAKTPLAAGNLSKQMRDRQIQKTYWAVVWGSPPSNGMLTHNLRKNKQSNIVETVHDSDSQGKKAVLSFTKLQEKSGLSLLSVHLQTGRPHQIRVQLAAEEHPVWGDYKYGKQEKPDGRTIALRATELILNHPSSGAEKRFILMPDDVTPWNQFDLSTFL